MSTDDQEPPQGEALSDELARKYDPERLLQVVSRRFGRGEALDASIRAKYEKRFGVDLGHVRVVTGEFAEEFNRQRDAYAVTVGGTGMILMGNWAMIFGIYRLCCMKHWGMVAAKIRCIRLLRVIH